MKKLMIMMAVVLVSTGCFAQKKAVNTAKNKAGNSETPDFVGAREAIASALSDAETKDQANTWYVAGFIGYKEIEFNMLQHQVFGKALDEKVLNEACSESYDYWLVADSLSQVLVADKKGNMKPADPKLRKQIADRMAEYYQKNYLISYAFNLYEAQKKSEAFDIAMKHLSIPTLEMMQEPKLQEKVARDTTYYTYKYYAGRFAYEAERYDEALAVFEDICTNDKDAALQSDVIFALEYIAEVKKTLQDTVGYIETLKRGFETYPQEPWFVQNLINYYLQVLKDEQGALEYVDKAIASDPQMQYYNLKGNLFLQANRWDDAMQIFEYMKSVDANNADAYEGIGRAYYFHGEALIEAAAYLSNKEFAVEKAKAKELYKQAIEPLEKSHSLNPTNRPVLVILKSIYYKLEMFEDNHRIVEILNAL